MRHSRNVHLVVPPGGSFRETRRIELDARFLSIGRAEACDVRVDVPGVDDEHAKISAQALVAVGPDCAIGDVPLDAGQRRLVTSGDEIQIGSVVLAVEGRDAGSEGIPRQAGPRIRVVEGNNFGSELLLSAENREYVIGRSAAADLVLEDREVSREHLKIVRRGLSVFIYDQASTRGSWLGRSAVYQGSRIEWERPRMLKIGATVLSLDLPEDARRAVPAAKISAPAHIPPKQKLAIAVMPTPGPVDAGPPPANIVAYHYEAKAPPSSRRIPVEAVSGRTDGALGAALATEVQSVEAAAFAPSSAAAGVPLRSGAAAAAGRSAWKKNGPAIGKTYGLLLLAVGGIAILGILFVVFSLME